MPRPKEESTQPRLLLGISICLLAYVFFIIASSLVWNFRYRFPTVQIIFIQNIVGLICILPIALRKGVNKLQTNVFPHHLIRDLSGVASYYLYFLAIRYLNLSDATTLNYTAPFFVPLIWWIWTKQKVDKHVWWSIAIGFVGIAIILNPTREIFQLGFVYGLFAGISSGVAFCSLRVLNIDKEPMSRTLFYYFSISACLTLPFTLAVWEHPTPQEWIETICIGIATVVAQILLTKAYRYGTAAYLSPLGYVTIIYAGISSWLIFDIPITLRSLLGTLLIIAGGIITYILRKHPNNIQEVFENKEDSINRK
jgi:drug/metabolite transporter (DMT)-like permease